VTDAAGALSETEFQTFQRSLARYGNKSRTLFASALVLGVLNNFAQGKLQVRQGEDTYGLAVTHVRVAVRPLDAVYHPLFEGATYGGYGVALDMSEVKYVYLGGGPGGPRHAQAENIQENDRDGRKDEFLTECGERSGRRRSTASSSASRRKAEQGRRPGWSPPSYQRRLRLSTDTSHQAAPRPLLVDVGQLHGSRVKPDEVIQPNGKVVVRNKSEYDRYYIQFQQQPAGGEGRRGGAADRAERREDRRTRSRSSSASRRSASTSTGSTRRRPDAGPVHQQITQLAIAQDLDGLVELVRRRGRYPPGVDRHRPLRGRLLRLHQGAGGGPRGSGHERRQDRRGRPLLVVDGDAAAVLLPRLLEHGGRRSPWRRRCIPPTRSMAARTRWRPTCRSTSARACSTGSCPTPTRYTGRWDEAQNHEQRYEATIDKLRRLKNTKVGSGPAAIKLLTVRR
jgi:hypothetical protein